jgi:hypothetical protein
MRPASRLIHDQFSNEPTAISMDPHYSDQLWIKDSRFEDISGPAVVISNEASRMTEINFENVLCRHVPVFVKLLESGREFAQPTESYRVNLFSLGLSLAAPGAIRGIQDAIRALSAHIMADSDTARYTPTAARKYIGQCSRARSQR